MCYIGEGNGDPLQCYIVCFGGLSWWLSGKESACNEVDAGDMGSIPGLGISPGGGPGNPLQYSYLENPRDRGAYSPWGCKELDTTDTTEHADTNVPVWKHTRALPHTIPGQLNTSV